MKFSFCPVCGSGLKRADLGGHPRQVCAEDDCGYVFWNNPTPVVTAVIEHEGELLLARNALWPKGMFTVIAGFLEPNEQPEEGIIRELEEELGLKGEVVEFLGMHTFDMLNHLILTYHVRAEGPITLSEEIAEYHRMPFSQGYYWPISTGLVLRDFLRARGHEPECRELPESMRAHVEEQASKMPNLPLD